VGTVVRVALLGVLLLSCSAIARAQEHDAEAHGLYSAGAAAFQSGRYDEALRYFQQAYDLSHRPELLYNVGQSADRARQDQVALDAFRQYLEATPTASNREEIEGRIRVLERATAAHQAAPPPSEPATPPVEPAHVEPAYVEPHVESAHIEPAPVEPAAVHDASPSDGGIDGVGLGLAIGGAAVAIGGVIMIVVGVPDLAGPNGMETYAETTNRQSTGDALVGVGGAAAGVGVVVAVIGGIMLATRSIEPHASALRLTPNGFAIEF
jgi:tetratricopeptide (TPR) repeat protein